MIQNAYDVLQLLSDGKFHSGTALAQTLKISRASIWKAVDYLRKFKLSIHAVSGRGYRWHEPFELLDKQCIMSALCPPAVQCFPRLELFKVIPSTNDYLLSRLSQGLASGTVCVAEAQTHGKGRLGRQWLSPFGANIYLSFYYRFCHRIHDLSGLSLIIALAVLEGLKSMSAIPSDLGIKWPNDIWYRDAKLGGILLESSTQQAEQSTTDIVVGMGINVDMSGLAPDLGQSWTDLSHIWGTKVSRNQIIAAILNKVAILIHRFYQLGFSDFMTLWDQYDILKNRKILLSTPAGTKEGIAKGVNERGELCVMVENNLIAVRYGEVSVKPKNAETITSHY